MPKGLIAGIDIGSFEIKLVVGMVDADDALNVVAADSVESDGVRKGYVSDLSAATMCVYRLLDRVRASHGLRFDRCLVSVDGPDIGSTPTSATVAVSGPKVSAADVRAVMNASRSLALRADQEILHVVPRMFSLDGSSGISSPVGMTGRHLSVDAHVIVASRSGMASRVSSVSDAGGRVMGRVAHAIASAEGVLSENDRDLGVCLVDIGADTTNLAVYKHSGLIHTSTIFMGGGSITNDLALGLGISVPAAEKLKVSMGDVLKLDSLKRIESTDIDLSRELQGVDLSLVREIVESRLAELFELICNDLKDSGCIRMIPAGIVLTGGTAGMMGISRFMTQMTGLRCNAGTPRRAMGDPAVAAMTKYACAAGLIRYAVQYSDIEGDLGAPGHDPLGLGQILRNFLRGRF